MQKHRPIIENILNNMESQQDAIVLRAYMDATAAVAMKAAEAYKEANDHRTKLVTAIVSFIDDVGTTINPKRDEDKAKNEVADLAAKFGVKNLKPADDAQLRRKGGAA